MLKQVEKTIAKRAGIIFGTSVLSHFIGPDIMEKVFNLISNIRINYIPIKRS